VRQYNISYGLLFVEIELDLMVLQSFRKIGCSRLIWRQVPWFILFLAGWRDPSFDRFLSRMDFIHWDSLFL